MDYVMVPVPEEHADAVMHLVQWRTSLSLQPPVDEEAILRTIGEADELGQELLEVVERQATDAHPVTVQELVEAIGCATREALGAILELNLGLMPAGAPMLVLPNGDEDSREWTLRMPDALAAAVRRLRDVQATENRDAASVRRQATNGT